jgi:hypothetical protein
VQELGAPAKRRRAKQDPSLHTPLPAITKALQCVLLLVKTRDHL